MYKPLLKRSTPTNTIYNTHRTIDNAPSQKQQKVGNGNDQIMISSKLLQTPNNQYKDKKSMLTPLFAQSHPYPPTVAQLINNTDNPSKKTLGAYKQINWISAGRKIEFWITGDRQSKALQFQGEICCVSLGQLKGSMLPMKIRNHYILAVAIKNDVTLYCLQSFTLRMWETGIRYRLDFSWEIQHIQFIDQNKLLFFSHPNYLQLVELGENHRIIQSCIPFYKKYLPTNFTQPNRTIENVIYSRNKIFVLFEEVKYKSWLVNTINRMIEDQESLPYIRFRAIEVYTINQNAINYSYKITEEDIKDKIRNFIEGSNDQIKIANIFISNDRDQELGIITTNGILVSFRDIKKGYLGKDPTFLQSTATYQSSPILSSVTSFSASINRESNCSVVNSLGFPNLTLTNESLLWVGENSVDGVHAQNIIAQIALRRSNKNECFLFNTKEWAVFTKQAFYTIRKLPIRHYLIGIIFYSVTQIDQYEPLSCQNNAYKKTIERIEQGLTPHKLLKNLIEVIISGERHMTINNILMELVCKELKGETIPNYRDWNHKLKPNIGKTQIQITNQILCKVWNLILQLQYKQNGKNKHICESSVYWLAIHQIYYQLVSPLFKFYPYQFKANKDMIQNIFHTLKSLQNFFQLKAKNQYAIRQQAFSTNVGKESFIEDLNQTNTSFDREIVDISWVQQGVKKIICNKIMSENIIQVQQRLKKAVSLTINLMTIYFGLSNQEVRLPSFGQILRNRTDQQMIKRTIISNSDFSTLLEIDSKIPQLGLKKDIDFKSWADIMEMQKPQLTNVDLGQLSRIISSVYFGQSLRLLGNRYELQLKMLQMYEQVIIEQRESLIQSNTLKQRNFINNSLFPEDEQSVLAFKREYLNSQLEQIIQQEKRCLRQAVISNNNTSQYSKMIDQLILIAANKPSLYDCLQNELRISGNIQKLSKLQKLKYRQFQKYAYNRKINPKSRYVERELFPNP